MRLSISRKGMVSTGHVISDETSMLPGNDSGYITDVSDEEGGGSLTDLHSLIFGGM